MVSFFLFLAFFIYWLQMDACLDAGGFIDKATNACISTDPDYIPLLERKQPIPFYVTFPLLALIPTIIVYRVTGKFSNGR